MNIGGKITNNVLGTLRESQRRLDSLLYKAPQDAALALAQYRASLPIEQGGLDLPPGNTPMERAAAMGAIPQYHGTNADVAAIDLARAGDKTGNPNARLGFFSTPNADEASRYATGWTKEGANVMPLMVMPRKTYKFTNQELNGLAMLPFEIMKTHPSYSIENGVPKEVILRANKTAGNIVDDYRADLLDKGYDSGIVNAGGRMEERIALDPAIVRSRFAAFDPFLKNSADLLAGLAPYAVPVAIAGAVGSSVAPSEAEAGIAGVLAKNADLGMLKIAEQAEARGLPMNKIYDATGFARGADDQWRWEFGDNDAELKMTPRAGQSGRQSGLFNNPGLYESYPDMKNLYAESQNMPEYSGSYHKAENGYPEKIKVNAGLNYKDMLSTMLHENQHGIQARENFATGGAPDWEQAKRADKFLPQWQQRGEVYDLMHNNNMTRDQVIKAYEGLPEQDFAEFYYDELSPGGLFSDLSKSDIEKSITHWKEQQDPEGVYNRLAGEVEARNVEGRRGMSSEYRRMLPFFDTEDVPRHRQIVRGVKSDPAVYSLAPSEVEASLKRQLIKSDREAMTHYAPKPMSAGGKAAREMAMEMMNPASWPLLWGSRGLGRPEDLRLVNGRWSSQ